MKYAWAHPRFKRADPQAVGEALEELRQQCGGGLRPVDVVEAARDEASPLHPLFEWDDTRAAQAHREQQARNVIGSLRVTVVQEPDRHVRMYVSVQQPKARAYVPIGDLVGDEAARAEVLSDALKGLKQWRRRYAELAELLPDLFEALDEAIGGE